MNFKELRERAKAKGINTFQKTGAELEKLLADDLGVGALGAQTETLSPQQQEAKESRTSGRKRRGGAVLGKGEYKLNRPEYERKGYQRRWFTNEPGRLSAAYENDWDYVEKGGQKVTLRDSTNKDGTLRTMYLMEKRADWYKEDQLKKREQDRKNERILMDGKVTAAGGKHGDNATQAMGGVTMYEPEGGIQVNTMIKQ